MYEAIGTGELYQHNNYIILAYHLPRDIQQICYSTRQGSIHPSRAHAVLSGQLTSTVSVSDLEYADNMALISETFEGLTSLLESLDSKCHQMGLTINYKKTKLLAVLPNGDSLTPSSIVLHPGCAPIEVVSSFEYLGSKVSSDCKLDAEVSTRITKASKAYGCLGRILWHQRKIKTSTKLSIFSSVVLSTLLYGLEAAVLLEPHVHRLQGFIMRCLRSILGVSLWDKKRNTTIRKTARLQRVSTMLTQRRLRLLGHILRMDEGHLPRKLLVCAPVHGKRSAGGQKKRWNDLVLEDLRQCDLTDDWKSLALNRSGWRSMVRAASQDINTSREALEKDRKDELKRRREARQTSSVPALLCSAVGCGFTASNYAGLVNHQRQKHGQPKFAQCQFCHLTFKLQGLHNHMCFCCQRPPTNPP